MKYSLLLTIISFGFLISSCQTEVTCETLMLNKVDQESFFADSTVSVLLDCGKLDSLDMEITKTPFFTEIVDINEFSTGKYDLKRFISEFQNFSKTDKYSTIRTTLKMQNKGYSAADWDSDKAYLVGKYGLSQEDADLLETVVKNPANASMTYTEAYTEMSKVKVQNILDNVEKMKSGN